MVLQISKYRFLQIYHAMNYAWKNAIYPTSAGQYWTITYGVILKKKLGALEYDAECTNHYKIKVKLKFKYYRSGVSLPS